MLSPDFLKSVIQNEVPAAIQAMQADFETYIRHVFGTGTDQWLAIINEYENKKQHDLRTKHAIKNPWIIEELLRPADNIWQSKGGDEQYKFKGQDVSEAFKLKLNDVREGMSMRHFMQEIWMQRFIADPNGLIFLEINKDLQGENIPKFTYKSIKNIRNYEVEGVKVHWVVFQPDEIIKSEMQGVNTQIEYSWAVDEKNYYHCKNTGTEFTIVETIEHSFGEVPAAVNSPIFNTDKGFRVSIFDKQTDLLNSYLTKNSIKEIYQFKHNYAIFWQFETLCPTCSGKRKVGNEICGSCGGTGFLGRKDVSDALVIPKYESDGAAGHQPLPPAGYVQPDVATCAENRSELDWLFDKLYHSVWGTTSARSTNDARETATAKFIDTQPVFNKLNEIANCVEIVQRQLTLIYGKFYYPKTLIDVRISYSRRYFIEPSDALLVRYQDAKAENAPEMTLNYMLEQYYYSEFASTQMMGDYYVKLMYVEPYVHRTIEMVDSLQVSDDIKQAKRYFPMWQKGINDIDVANKTIDDLIKDLMAFAAKQKPITPAQPIKPNGNPVPIITDPLINQIIGKTL